MWHSQDWYILGLVSTFWPEPRGAGLQEASQFMSVCLSVYTLNITQTPKTFTDFKLATRGADQGCLRLP